MWRNNRLQVSAQHINQIRAFQAESDLRRNEADAIAEVIAYALELVAIDFAALGQRHQRVGQLNFAARARLALREQLEDIRGQNVAPHDRKFAGRFFRRRLLDHAMQFVDSVAHMPSIGDPILRDLTARDFQQRDHWRIAMLASVEQLAQAWPRAIENVVGEHHRKWRIAYRRSRLQHGVAEPERFRLFCNRDLRGIVAASHQLEDFVFATLLEVTLEFRVAVEVIDHRGLAWADDDHDLLDTRGDRFLHHDLDRRGIDHRQNFLGDDL